MFLNNCVRQINKIYLNRCLNKTIQISTSQYGTFLNQLQNNEIDKTNTKSNSKITIFRLNPLQNHRSNGQRQFSTTNRSLNRKARDDDEDDDDEKDDKPVHTHPSLYNLTKNALTSFYIRRFIDRDFNRNEFINGTKYAIEVISIYTHHSKNAFINFQFIRKKQKVSKLFAGGHFEALTDLVDETTLMKLRELIEPKPANERRAYIINRSNILWAIPYDIQFVKNQHDDNDGINRTFIEIMMVFLIESDSGKIYIVNYRFVKEFTEGVEDDWTINHIQHSKSFGSLRMDTDDTQ